MTVLAGVEVFAVAGKISLEPTITVICIPTGTRIRVTSVYCGVAVSSSPSWLTRAAIQTMGKIRADKVISFTDTTRIRTA